MNLITTIAALSTMMLTATNPLLDQQWTQGDVSQVQAIANALGQVGVWVISIVGIAIVEVSLMRNAICGLYACNPEFFDKVDELKKQYNFKSNKEGGGGADVNKYLGFALSLLLSFVPNVKAITVWSTENDGSPSIRMEDKKQFFTKALVMLVVQIFIGTFIYAGYPAKISGWIGSVGTRSLDILMANIDPIEMASDVMTKWVYVTYRTDGMDTEYYPAVNDGARGAYAATSSKLDDMTKSMRPGVATQGEDLIESAFSDIAGNSSWAAIVSDSNSYEYTCNVSVVNGIPATSNSYQTLSSDGSTVVVKGYQGTSSSKLVMYYQLDSIDHGSAKSNPDYYIRLDYTYTRVARNKAAKTYNREASDISVDSTQLIITLSTLQYSKDDTTSGNLVELRENTSLTVVMDGNEYSFNATGVTVETNKITFTGEFNGNTTGNPSSVKHTGNPAVRLELSDGRKLDLYSFEKSTTSQGDNSDSTGGKATAE